MKYYINDGLYIDRGVKGLGVYTAVDIDMDTNVEYSPVVGNYVSRWSDVPYELKKVVFSFPQGSDNYVIGLGYLSLYNHDDDSNCMWYSDEYGIVIRTIRRIRAGDELCINYGEGYWSGGWVKV